MRGLVRVLVVGFTVVSLLIVAAVGVSASSGKIGSSNTLKNSVKAVFAGHFDQGGFHEGSSSGEGDRGGHEGEGCKHHKKHHGRATGDQENDQCGDHHGDDSGSSG